MDKGGMEDGLPAGGKSHQQEVSAFAGLWGHLGTLCHLRGPLEQAEQGSQRSRGGGGSPPTTGEHLSDDGKAAGDGLGHLGGGLQDEVLRGVLR